MSAGRVRQGGVFVEIGADARKFFATLEKVNKSVGKVGASIANVGGRMAGIGAAMAAPFVAAGVAGARFQDVMLNVQASTGGTTAELEQVRKAAMAMSQSLGVGPTEAASGFLELLKAGMSVEQVLGGAGKAAIAFAKVGGLAVADAAVVMADAMNVFKVSGDVAANTLSAAADASSTSIEGIAQAFSQVSAVAGLANQSIQDTAASLAVLANAGIKGSDAGTSLKTMLMRLMAPAEDAVGALAQVGLSVQSFRNADGTMKPMVEIIRTLSTALGGMDQAAKDDIFRRIFGQDAIRAAAVMTAAGVDGFNAMRDGMNGAMGVGDKYATMQSGLSGAVATLYASLERLAIVVSDAVGPSFASLANMVAPVIDGFSRFLQANQTLVVQAAKGIAVFTGVGIALVGIGVALKLVSAGVALLMSPLALAVGLAAGLTAAALTTSGALGDLATTASTTFRGIFDAIAAGDLAGAMDILWAGLLAGWLRGVEAIMGYVDPWISMFQNTFTYLGTSIATTWESMWSGLVQGGRTFGAVLQGAFDNVINGILGAFDTMVAAVRKSWNWVQSFIRKGYDLAKENEKVDTEMEARRREREVARPGVRGRMAEAAKQNAQTAREAQSNINAMNRAADATAQDREAANAARAGDRRAATVAAETRLAGMTRAQSDQRSFRAQADSVVGSLGTASTMDEVRDLAVEFHLLAATGKLTQEQMKAFADAAETAQDRLEESAGAGTAGGPSAAPVDPDALRRAAADAAASQSEVAGSFSADAFPGMGFGSSLQQKQLDELKGIRQEVKKLNNDGAVAP